MNANNFKEIWGRWKILLLHHIYTCGRHLIAVDFALISAQYADRWGNLTYRKTARNFGPVMAMAAKHTIALMDEVVPLGTLEAIDGVGHCNRFRGRTPRCHRAAQTPTWQLRRALWVPR